MYVRELRDSDAILEQDHKVPEYCWNAGISKDICEAWTRVVQGTFSVDLLSDTEFLVYHIPKTTRGMSDHEARCYADLIMGSYLWARSPATVFVTKRTTQEARRDKVKTRDYRRKITVRRMAATQAGIKDLEMVTQKCQECTANPVVRGRGMIRRADKYLAQRHGKEPERIPGTVPVLPAFSDRAATPDDYHSAREPSESEYDTEETDPEEDRDVVEGDDDDVSVGSDTTFKATVMIQTEPIGRPLPTGPRGVTSESVRKVGGGIPPILGRKTKGIRARWSCLYSRTPQRKVP